jgi:hypothetical protein
MMSVMELQLLYLAESSINSELSQLRLGPAVVLEV